MTMNIIALTATIIIILGIALLGIARGFGLVYSSSLAEPTDCSLPHSARTSGDKDALACEFGARHQPISKSEISSPESLKR